MYVTLRFVTWTLFFVSRRNKIPSNRYFCYVVESRIRCFYCNFADKITKSREYAKIIP